MLPLLKEEARLPRPFETRTCGALLRRGDLCCELWSQMQAAGVRGVRLTCPRASRLIP